MAKPKPITLHVAVPQDLKDRIRKIAEEEDRPTGYITRRLLVAALDAHDAEQEKAA